MYVFDWDNFVGLTTAIGSIATAWSVRLLLQQRKDSVKPNVLISHSTKLYKIVTPLRGLSKITGPNNEYPFFSLINPGNGLAIQIKAKAIIDYKYITEHLKKYDTGNLFEIRCSDNYLNVKKISDQSEKSYTFGSKKPWKTSTLIDLKTDNTINYQIKFDLGYTNLILALHHIAYENQNYTVVEDFPSIFYKITYKDDLGNKYNSIYRLDCKQISGFFFMFKKVKKIKSQK